jgi:flagellar biogenesis protein FliO
MRSAFTDSLLQRTPGFLGRLTAMWSRVSVRRRERSLRVCETVSLGDKRFVAVLQFERQRFLIGITAQSVSLLHRLGAPGRPAAIPASGPGQDELRGDQP